MAWVIAASLAAFAAGAQAAETKAKPAADAPVAAAAPAPLRHTASPYHPVSLLEHANDYYHSIWGVDNFKASETASGNLIRFSYRVVDPKRAKGVNNKEATPYMYGQRSQAVLHVPAMEQVGQLRQAGEPEAGKDYWMVFSNKGHPVKPGDRVDVVIGSFRVNGLIVE